MMLSAWTVIYLLMAGTVLQGKPMGRGEASSRRGKVKECGLIHRNLPPNTLKIIQGTTAMYRCRAGFKFVTGDKQIRRKCRWRGRLPACQSQQKVLIVGAGVSGLMAAQTLLEHQVDVTVLEASDRVGGRVWSLPFYGITAEIGAHWIHGIKGGNPIWELAQELQIGGVYSDYENYTFRNLSGFDVTEEADKEYERFPGYTRVSAISRKMQQNDHEDRSVRSTMRMDGWHLTTGIRKAMEYYDIDFECGDRAEETSTKFFTPLKGDDISGGDFFINDARGYQAIPEAMANNVTSHPQGRILKNQWVTRIEYSDSGCKVTTKTGDVFEADICISTVSLGVLQMESIDFVPSLPEWKREAIHKHTITTYVSIYLKFPDNTERFWDDTQFILYASPRRGHYTVWANYEAPGLLPPKSGIFMTTLIGDELEKVALLPKDKIIADVMVALRNMYGPDIPDAVDVLVPPFTYHPLFYGSFSNWPIGFTEDDMDAFRAPLGRLFFSGEACSPEFFGYVHGAYFEGIDSAKKALACMKEEECETFLPMQ